MIQKFQFLRCSTINNLDSHQTAFLRSTSHDIVNLICRILSRHSRARCAVYCPRMSRDSLVSMQVCMRLHSIHLSLNPIRPCKRLGVCVRVPNICCNLILQVYVNLHTRQIICIWFMQIFMLFVVPNLSCRSDRTSHYTLFYLHSYYTFTMRKYRVLLEPQTDRLCTVYCFEPIKHFMLYSKCKCASFLYSVECCSRIR